jgi:hypothetical protein
MAGHAEGFCTPGHQGAKAGGIGLDFRGESGFRPGVYDHHERHGWYWCWGWISGGVLGYHLDGGLVVFHASGAMEGEHGVFGRLLGLERDGVGFRIRGCRHPKQAGSMAMHGYIERRGLGFELVLAP